MSFRGKVVIVTGSGQGIGRCIALTYASKEARVVVAEKNSDAGSDTERQIVSFNTNLRVLSCFQGRLPG